MNTDGTTDQFAFVALTDLPAGETVYFTDRGWDPATREFRPGENWLGWTVPGGGVAKGTVTILGLPGSLTPEGDQLTAYQMDGQGRIQPLASLNNFGSGWQETATDAYTSAIPSDLSEGHTAMAAAHSDNLIYDGPFSGTQVQLLASIHDPANWSGANTYTWSFNSLSFSVGNGPAVVSMGDVTWTDEAAGTLEIRVFSSRTGTHTANPILMGGTAQAGLDYSLSGNTLGFANSRVQTLSLTLVDDADCEASETLELGLQVSGFAANYSNGATLTIADNDGIPYARYQGFESSPADNWNFTYTPATYNTETNGDPDVYGTESVWEAVRSFSLTYYAPQGDRFWGMQDLDNIYGGGNFWHILDFEPLDLAGVEYASLSFKYFTYNQTVNDPIEYAVMFDNGTNWSNYTALPYNTGAWVLVEVPIPAGSSHVRLRVRARENQDLLCGGVDEIQVNGVLCGSNFEVTTGVVPTEICADGGTLPVPFTSSGSFLPGNIFTAELSDATGSFASPTILGSLAASGTDPSGTILGQLPANLPTGTGYRVRVVSSAPAVVGTDNGLDISVQAIDLNAVATVYSHGHHVTCAGAADGAIDLQINSGTAPFGVQWTGPNGFSAVQEDIGGLSAGTYTALVTDANGCTAEVSLVLTEPTLALTASSTDITCQGNADGSVNASASGGASPYTFDWTGPGGYTAQGANQTGLSAGTYTVQVTDSYGCTATQTVVVTEPASLLANLAVATNPCGHAISCAGGSDGAIDLQVLGGTPPYAYQWVGPGGFGSAVEDLSNLSAGTYQVMVTDAAGCQLMLGTTLTEPAPLFASVDAMAFNCGFTVSCHGASDGTAFVVGTGGGCPPYSYAWSNGDTDSIAQGLSAGTYSVTVTDAGGCTLVESLTLNEPGELTAQASAVPASCSGAANGSIDLNSNGGCLPHSISWTGPGGFQSADFNPDSLLPGIYSYVLTDPNGCTTSGSIEVTALNDISASIGCCQDTAVCAGDSVDLSIVLTGQGPFELTYLVNQDTQTAIAGAGALVLPLQVNETTHLELISVVSLFSGCEGSVCGAVTIGVNDCGTPCEDLCVNAGVLNVVDNGSCQSVEMEIACDTACGVGGGGACPGTRVLSFDHDPDGNPIPAGTVVANQWASMGVTFSFVNNNPNHVAAGVIFDSSNPTGGDFDLGTPHQDFGGPGIGSGGAQGAAGQNDQALGNLLVLAENTDDANNDGLIDDPDDEGAGGEMQMNFAWPLYVESLSMVDLDNGNGIVRIEQVNGQVTDLNIPGLGDNAVTTIPIEMDSVVRVRVILPGSGGISALAYCPGGPEFIDISIPCGTVNSFSNSAGLPMEVIQGDSLTGITGLRIHGLPSDCLDSLGQPAFTVSYEICGLSNTCEPNGCLPLVAIGRNGCVQYEMAVAGPVEVVDTTTPDKGDPGVEAPEGRVAIFPNPVHDQATAELFLREGGLVRVEIFDGTGVLLREVRRGELPKGEVVQVPFSANVWPAGVYFVRMQTTEGAVFSQKFVVMP